MARCQNDVVVPKEERIAGYWYPDSCPEVVVIEEVAQRQLPLTTAEENSLLCGKGCEESTLSRDILNFYNSLPTCLEEPADDIFYWDQSGAVMMDSTDFCTSWKEMSVTIVVVRGRLYSTIQDLMDGSGASVKICTDVDHGKFNDMYWKPFGAGGAGLEPNKNHCSGSKAVPNAFVASEQTASTSNMSGAISGGEISFALNIYVVVALVFLSL